MPPFRHASWRRLADPWVLGCLFCLFTDRAAGQEDPATTGVEVTLVADTTAVGAGKPFRAGVLIRHSPGFHTYWMAPGIVGLPTRIEWLLPEGFAASPLQWPAPEFTHMFEYRAYGYESDTLLFATITPPEEPSALPAGDPVVLHARVTWMACAESCHPGTRVLTSQLPVAGESSPAQPDPLWHPTFEAAAAAVPSLATLPGSKSDRRGQTFTLEFEAEPGADLAGLEFLSSDNLFDPNHPQRVTEGSPVTLSLTLMEAHPTPLPNRLRGLLYRPSGWPSAAGAPFVRIDLPTVSH